MLGPTSNEPNILPGSDLPKVAHGGVGGGQFSVRVRSETDHREPPVITTEKHVLDHALEDLF
jgi:hypothetical protein